MWNDLCSSTVVLLALAVLISLPGSESLQCYNCRGITNYDPNECFTPVEGKTVLQECQKGEVCEKRVTMVDRLQDVIDRGCSSNCAGRSFVWTDEFQVYCCNNQDVCNGAPREGIRGAPGGMALLILAAVIPLLYATRW